MAYYYYIIIFFLFNINIKVRKIIVLLDLCEFLVSNYIRRLSVIVGMHRHSSECVDSRRIVSLLAMSERNKLYI